MTAGLSPMHVPPAPSACALPLLTGTTLPYIPLLLLPSPGLPWPSAGIPADASPPLRANNNLTLLQLSSPHRQSSLRSAAGQSSNNSLLPVMLTIVFACTHGLALLLLSSAEALTSLSPPYLSGALAVSSLHSACFKAMFSSRLWSCLGNRLWSAGIPGRQEGQMMAHGNK